MSKRWLLLAAILLFPFAARADLEQRCMDLGANCVCSEPLDTATHVFNGTDRYNPNDSVTKECGFTVTDFPVLGDGDDHSHVPDPAFAPLSNVTNVLLRSGNPSPHRIEGKNASHTSSTKRMCHRHYFTFDSSYEFVGEGGCTANNLWELTVNQVENVGLVWNIDGLGAESITVNNFDINQNGLHDDGTPTLPTQTSGGWTLEDCRSGNWCRAEICYSGDLQAGTDLFAEAWIHNVSNTNKSIHFGPATGPFSLGNQIESGNSSWSRIGLNNQRASTCSGSRYITHIMQAQWVSDAGQTIGPSFEVEEVPPVEDVDVEQQCLGVAECQVSETYTSTSYTQQPFGSNFCLFNADSSVTKEGRLGAGWGFSNAGMYIEGPQCGAVSSVVPSLPIGTVGRVLKSTQFSGGWHSGEHRVVAASTKRICWRWYVYTTPDYEFKNNAFGGTCENAKWTEFAWGHPTIRLESAGSAFPVMQQRFSNWDISDKSRTLTSPDSTNLTHTKGQWTKYIQCFSSPNGVTSGQNISAEAYIDIITGPDSDTQVMSTGPTLAGNSTGGFNKSMFGNTYRQGQCAGHREFAFGSQWAWDTDTGQLPPPAIEMEGGQAQTPPEPDPPPPTSSVVKKACCK